MPNYSDDLTSGQVLRASIAFLALNMCVAVIALFAMWLSSFIKGQLQDLALLRLIPLSQVALNMVWRPE